MTLLLMLLFFFIILVSARCIFFSIFIRGKSVRALKPLRLMVVLGSGGHTTEVLSLLRHMSPIKYDPVTFVLAASDSTSAARATLLQRAEEPVNGKLVKIPRSREVGQPWISSIWSTLSSIIYAFPLVWKERPDVILCNGPGTCVPLCFAGWLFSVMGIHRTVITFVESICRVKTLSLSGQILYYFSDVFFVQHETLKESYPNSIFLGRLV